jgi:hypothetical protein
MSAHTLSQTPTTVRQIVIRYRWIIGLNLLSVVTALALYRFSSVPAVATPAVSVSQASGTDPAQQGVLDYVRAHQALTEARPVDPAQQGVIDYLRAHTVAATRPLDTAQQGVIDYLRAHRVAATRPLDTAQQGVLDYLRAHNS